MISLQRTLEPLRAGFFASLMICSVWLLTAPAAAQSPLSLVNKAQGTAPAAGAADKSDKVDQLSAEDVRKRQQELAAEIAAYESSKTPEGISDTERARRLRTLKFIGFTYQRHLNALTELDESRRVSEEAEKERTEWTGFSETPPYSIMMTDRLNSELQRRIMAQQTAEAQIKIIDTQIQRAREGLKKSRETMRLAQEKAERASSSQVDSESWRLSQAKLEERSAISYLSALLAARESAHARKDEAARSASFTAGQLKRAEAQVSFSASDLASLKARIDERQTLALVTLEKANSELDASAKDAATTAKQLDSARANVTTLQRELVQVRGTLEGAEADAERAKKSAGILDKLNPFSGAANKSEIKKLQQRAGDLEARLKSAQGDLAKFEREALLMATRHRNAVIAIDLDNSRLALLEVERAFWEMRYGAHEAGPDASEKRRNMAERSQEMLKVLAPQATQLRTELDATMDQIVAEQDAIAKPADARDAAFHARMQSLLTARERAYRQSVSESGDLQQMLLRIVDDYATTMSEMSALQRMGHWFDLARNAGLVVWRYEIFSVEDTIEIEGRTLTGSRGITVGKILQGILLVVIGYMVINLLTRFFLALATRRLKIDPMEAQIAHKWIMTGATAVLALMAMELLKIPLAAFAFLGGAIAIGVGFGMQTLLKNLISGLMLLLERPFKIRDVVEVGGIRGEITGINIRSCTIRSVTGIETLVPNSTFLEQNVTNWTLSNQTVRYTVSIGVAYDAPVDEVARLLREVADRQPAVVRDPAPEVIFEDFGDNALMFSLNVWLVIGQNQIPSRVVLSDLRFMISRSFAEHGIGIPYPQRDVHLDTTSPLSVRVVANAQ